MARSIRRLGLAGAAVLALTAFAGVASASAASTTLCNQALSPCASGNQYVANTVFYAKLKSGTNAVLTTSGGLENPTVTCTDSETSLQNTAQTGNPLGGKLDSLEFDDGSATTPCTSVNPSATCTVTVPSGAGPVLPWSGDVNLTTAGDGTFTVDNPNVTVSCTGLPTCSYSASSVQGTLNGGNPAEVVFNDVPLSVSGGFGCPTGAQWTATYDLVSKNSSPTAVWVETP